MDRNRKIIIAVVVLLVALALCCLVANLVPDTEENDVIPTDTVAVVEEPVDTEPPIAVLEPTDTLEPTNTPIPTNTPLPTNTPIPTSTPDPNFISRGTYIVNVDIEPGIYRGMGGVGLLASCYWERLKDLSGELSAIIANENAQGQFYVEVGEDDFAFHVDCDMWRLDPMPEPLDEFPDEIDVGMYLVGIDILPGLYQGSAGDDILTSCYWQRMRDAKHTLQSIIANDNATGQFYIQVSPTDFALQVACPLARVID
jgi:hypothetical protein